MLFLLLLQASKEGQDHKQNIKSASFLAHWSSVVLLDERGKEDILVWFEENPGQDVILRRFVSVS